MYLCSSEFKPNDCLLEVWVLVCCSSFILVCFSLKREKFIEFNEVLLCLSFPVFPTGVSLSIFVTVAVSSLRLCVCVFALVTQVIEQKTLDM